MNISRIGIDLAKNVFQLHGVDRHGKAVWKRRLKHDQWLKAVVDQATHRIRADLMTQRTAKATQQRG